MACDSVQSFNDMTQDGRNILLEFLDMCIVPAKSKKSNFPKTFIESKIGYISGPSKNGALKQLGYFTDKTWNNTDYYPECKWKWRCNKVPGCKGPLRMERNSICMMELISSCKNAGYNKQTPYLDKLIIYMINNPGKHINLEYFEFDTNLKNAP